MSALSDLAGSLAPLLDSDRGLIFNVRFIGSKTDLLAFATDGHVLARVTVLGDFSHVGDATLPGRIAQRLGSRDWDSLPWCDPDEDKDLAAEAHLQPPCATDLTLEKFASKIPSSAAPVPSVARWLGPAIATLGTVADRLGVSVQFGGSLNPFVAMRVDSLPVLRTKNGDLMWVSFAIMPGRAVTS